MGTFKRKKGTFVRRLGLDPPASSFVWKIFRHTPCAPMKYRNPSNLIKYPTILNTHFKKLWVSSAFREIRKTNQESFDFNKILLPILSILLWNQWSREEEPAKTTRLTFSAFRSILFSIPSRTWNCGEQICSKSASFRFRSIVFPLPLNAKRILKGINFDWYFFEV